MNQNTIPRERILRRILAVGTALLLLLFILFLRPSPEAQYPPGGYLNYEQIVQGLGDDSLAADELEPDRYAVNVPSVEHATVMASKEAESVYSDGRFAILTERPGYRGTGYVKVAGRNIESAFTLRWEVRATQHYDITICMAADRKVTNRLRINGMPVTDFTLQPNEQFVLVTFYGIFLEEGEVEISIDTVDGGLFVDYFEMTSESTVMDIDFDIADMPCDPDATAKTVAMYQYLHDHWNENLITGQYVSDARNRELALIYEMTGQLPLIRFSSLGDEDTLAQIEAAMDWHLYTGGFVGLMWHWNAPGSDTVYAEETDFSLMTVLYGVSVEQLAKASPQELQQMAADGKISGDCLQLMEDIDAMAAHLAKFANMDIPILWRPLHEAGGGWYWWGADGANAYLQLWLLLYNRMTKYHQLHNLIWLWNGQSASYMVPEDTYDIASVDVYLSPDMPYGSRYEQFISLARITEGKKMLGLSECSSLPDIEMLMLDRTIWSFFGLWYGDYIMKSDGTFSDSYYSSSDLYNLYNSDRTLSLNDFRLSMQ